MLFQGLPEAITMPLSTCSHPVTISQKSDTKSHNAEFLRAVPHALHVFEILTGSPGYPDDAIEAAAYAAGLAADYQATQGLIAPAEATLRAVLQIWLRTRGADHPDTIATRHSIARRMAERADFVHAELEYRNVLDALRRTLGPEHPDTLHVQHNTASLISFQGHFAQAEAEYREVLAVKLKLLGPDHPDTLTTRHEVAG